MSVTRTICGLVVASVALAGGVAQAQTDDWRWEVYIPGEAVQFGVPDTDLRSLRVDCIDGRLSIGGPAYVDGEEGQPTRVKLGGRDLPAELVYAGDGMDFTVEVEASDPAFAILLAGRALEIEQGGERWEVPGDGAARVLKPLLKGCRRG